MHYFAHARLFDLQLVRNFLLRQSALLSYVLKILTKVHHSIPNNSFGVTPNFSYSSKILS